VQGKVSPEVLEVDHSVSRKELVVDYEDLYMCRRISAPLAVESVRLDFA